jgi:hypothetical protein
VVCVQVRISYKNQSQAPSPGSAQINTLTQHDPLVVAVGLSRSSFPHKSQGGIGALSSLLLSIAALDKSYSSVLLRIPYSSPPPPLEIETEIKSNQIELNQSSPLHLPNERIPVRIGALLILPPHLGFRSWTPAPAGARARAGARRASS